MEHQILLKERLGKLFVLFVLPCVFSMVISGVQGMVDGIFLGNFVDPNAMASVNIAQPYMQIFIGCSMILSIGALSFLGRSLGEEKWEQAKDIFQTALIALTVISLVLGAVGVCFSRPIAHFLGANAVLLTGTAQYIFTIGFFVPIIMLMFHCGFTLRLLGKPYLYFIATIASLLMNIAMDTLFIAVLDWGVMGAALGTGLAYLAAFLIVSIPMLSKTFTVNIREGHFRWKLCLQIMANGSSEGVTSASAALTMFLFNRVLMQYAGEAGVAAFTAINYLGQFVLLIMFGVADGINAIVSYNYGAGQLLRVKQTMTRARCINFAMGILVFVVLLVFGEAFIGLFIQDQPEIQALAVTGAKLYGLAFFLNGFNILESCYYTALGRAVESILLSASRGLVFIVIGVFAFTPFLEVQGVWLAVPFAEGMTVLLALVLALYHRQKDKKTALDGI